MIEHRRVDDERPSMLRGRLEAMDSLRAFAALAIMIFHYEAMSITLSADELVEMLRFRYAMLGVELFFVISGFVILMTIEKTTSVSEFLLGRAARIYPAYWLSILVAAAVLLWDGQGVGRIALVNLTMLQSFVHVKCLIAPYWTLAYELWFYVVIALVFQAGLVRHVALLSAVWLLFAFAVRLLGFHSYGLSGILSMLPFGHLFIAGMMIYILYRAQGTLLTKLVLLGCVIYASFGREDWSHVSGWIYFSTNGIFLAVVYLAASGRLNVIATRSLVWIGQASYSLYLLHVPIALLAILLVQRAGWSNWIGVMFAVPLSFAAAALSRRWIELPGQRAIRSLRFAEPA